MALVAFVIGQFKGCGQTCTLTSDAANEVAAKIDPMFQAYMQSGHTQSEQAAYLSYFDQMWAQLVQYCGQASMSKAGQNCISDRQSGACTWKSSTWGWAQEAGAPGNVYTNGVYSFIPSGPNGSGSQCWNWQDYYRASVANDPTVVADTPAVTAAAQQIESALGISLSPGTNLMPVLIAAALIIAAVML